ncbi:LysR family transcriptional regulator [Skermanella stibiiresistens SB22]|uniref:LysR family transcriptional regulator n=1 Tax=Skermanella stibiiresistens SB22 TaxID=1385369 RepID=W9H7M3_9PROT|nr:LysR family transcriptional regulator [Skermanella stibiiresistens]EWY39798.1 LysR family transcriptional regulator [Skermanella stibiiresistens SB22]
MDRLDDMVLFIRVVEARSFTQAADRLSLSKSAVSRRVSDLENRLGARLLNRTTRSLSLTEVGRAFYDRCARIVADVEEAERSVADLHALPRGTLRINAPMSFGMMHIAPAIAEFLRRHPAVEIDMDLNDRYIDLIEEGYDVAVRIGRLRDSSLVARRLAPNRMVVVGSPAYFKSHGRPSHPDDLTGHNCLLYTNAPLADQWQFTVGGSTRSVKVTGSLRVNNGEVLREAAVAGLGIAVLPTFIIGEQIARGQLDVALLDFAAGDSAVHAVYPHGRHLSPKVRVFVDFLAGRFGPVPYWDASLHVLSGG